MLHFSCSTDHFLLTLTLSLPPSRRAKARLRRDGGREREQQASDWCLANGRCAKHTTDAIARRWTILPLPRGEGRGEGEPSLAPLTLQSDTKRWHAKSIEPLQPDFSKRTGAL